MRYCLLIFAIVFCQHYSYAQHKESRAETTKRLKETLTQQYPGDDKNGMRYETKMCINFNLLPEIKTAKDVDNPKFFRDKIETKIFFAQEVMHVQNNIYKKDKLRETYTYQIALSAIESATLTNCQKNTTEDVNAYVNRPIFVRVRKKSTKIGRQIFDHKGMSIDNLPPQCHLNEEDADWDSIIPLAGNWDGNAALRDKVISAFDKLTSFNKERLTAK